MAGGLFNELFPFDKTNGKAGASSSVAKGPSEDSIIVGRMTKGHDREKKHEGNIVKHLDSRWSARLINKMNPKFSTVDNLSIERGGWIN